MSFIHLQSDHSMRNFSAQPISNAVFFWPKMLILENHASRMTQYLHLIDHDLYIDFSPPS